MEKNKIVLLSILAAVLAIALGTFAVNYVAPADDTLPATFTPAATPIATATPKQTSPQIQQGGFVVNDSMAPPPETPVPAPSGNPVMLSLEAPETALVGDIFTVEIKVNPNSRDVNGIQTELRFDKGLTVNSITMSGEVDKDFSIPPVVNNEQGTIENIAGMSSSSTFPAKEFTFAVISLTAKEPGNAELRLERNAATYASGTNTPILLPTKAEEKVVIIKATG